MAAFGGGIGRLLTFLPVVGLASCAATIHEVHYFASVHEDQASGESEIVNVFRLEVDGGSTFSNLRYMAGEYDERAIDFFLNETKSEDYAPANGLKALPPIFDEACAPQSTVEVCREDYQKSLQLYGLAGTGTTKGQPLDNFVMILSANADAIAESIGAFAESEIAIRSMNYLLNKDTYDAAKIAEAQKAANSTFYKVSVDTLDHMFEANSSNDSDDTLADMVILQTIATILEPEGSLNFNTIDQAESWFSVQK